MHKPTTTRIISVSRAARAQVLRRLSLKLDAARHRARYAEARAHRLIAEVAQGTGPDRVEAAARAELAIAQVRAARDSAEGYRVAREALRAEGREETAAAKRERGATMRALRGQGPRAAPLEVGAAPVPVVLAPPVLDREEDR